MSIHCEHIAVGLVTSVRTCGRLAHTIADMETKLADMDTKMHEYRMEASNGEIERADGRCVNQIATRCDGDIVHRIRNLSFFCFERLSV